MSGRWPPAGHDRQRELFSDDAEPCEPPREVVTRYEIRPLYGQPGTGGRTYNPAVAERASRKGHRVTATTFEVVE